MTHNHTKAMVEAKLLKLLQGSPGVAEASWWELSLGPPVWPSASFQVYYFGVEKDYAVMAMELMGPSLEEHPWPRGNCSFKCATCCADAGCLQPVPAEADVEGSLPCEKKSGNNHVKKRTGNKTLTLQKLVEKTGLLRFCVVSLLVRKMILSTVHPHAGGPDAPADTWAASRVGSWLLPCPHMESKDRIFPQATLHSSRH